MKQNKKIKWVIGESFDDAGDSHCYFHYAFGKDNKGKEYTAVAVVVDDNLEEIEDIEPLHENSYQRFL